MNSVKLKPAEEKKVTGTTGSTKSKSLFADEKSEIGKAMRSKEKGVLANALITDQDKFGIEFEKLNETQQKSVVKVLENKGSKSLLEAFYETNKDSELVGLEDSLDISQESKTSGGFLGEVLNSTDYKTQLKNLKNPKDFNKLSINELEKVIRTQKERHPAGTRTSAFAEKELSSRSQNAVRGQKISRYMNRK